MSRPRLYIRKFLNKPGYHAGAYILVKVADDHIVFKVSDCFDTVSLDFDLDGSRYRRNSLHKAHVLLDAVSRFVDALEAEAAAAEDRERSERAS